MQTSLDTESDKYDSTVAHESGAGDWLKMLGEAVTNVDEHSIFRILDEQGHKEEAQEALTNMVGRMAYRHDAKNVFSEIFMMPVITSPGCNAIGHESLWKSIRKEIRYSVGTWFELPGTTTIFDNIVPMDQVTTWQPSVLRAHLQRLIPGAGKTHATFPLVQLDLPPDAPRLGFVVIGRSVTSRWPELPAANAAMDKRLKEVVKFCLQYETKESPVNGYSEPIVLTPERIQFAISDGIAVWLQKMSELVGIDGWVIAPSIHSRDVVKVTLKLKSQSVTYTQFTLKLHQIGLSGMADIFRVLKDIAPMLDAPVDS